VYTIATNLQKPEYVSDSVVCLAVMVEVAIWRYWRQPGKGSRGKERVRAIIYWENFCGKKLAKRMWFTLRTFL
jgi:hypothetical protein